MNDPELQRFINAQAQKQKFQQMVNGVADQCWDTCMTGTPGPSLDKKTEGCISKCVNRFLDVSHFVVQRLENEGENYVANERAVMSGEKKEEKSSKFFWQ